MQETDWLARVLLTAAVIAAVIACLMLMRLGWVRRGRRQAGVAALPEFRVVPESTDPRDVTNVEARYLGANREGDWLDRVVAHGMGVPSPARITVRVSSAGASRGVWITRHGAPDIFVVSHDVVGVRHDRAAAGRAYGDGGVLLITWRHGDDLIDLGLRVREAECAERVRAAVSSVITPTNPARVPSVHGDRP